MPVFRSENREGDMFANRRTYATARAGVMRANPRSAASRNAVIAEFAIKGALCG